MTTRIFAAVVAASLGLAMAAAPASAQQVSPAQAGVIKAEVTAAVDTYYRLFSEQKMAALPEQVYNIPWILISASGPQADLTKAQALERFNASLKQLLANGWGKSVFTTTSVCVLNANAAIASGFNTRLKTDGSVLQVMGVTYVFGKTPEGWRIVTYTSTPADKIIRCD